MYDLIGLEPDDFYDDEDLAVAGFDDLDDYDDLDAIAGFDDFDDEDLDAIAGAYELVGLDLGDDYDDELDAIAGLDDYDDYDDYAVAGDDYPLPGSVEELLDIGATAGRGRPRRRGRPAARPRGRVRARPGASRAAAVRAARARRATTQARRTTSRARRAVRTMGRRVQRERALRQRAVRAARTAASRGPTRPPRPARTIPSVTGGSTQVVQKQPQVSGPQVVPFSAATPIAPGETRVLTARPQVVFRPNQFQVAGRIAEYFRINAIRIGNQNQFAASGSVPAEAFSGNHPMPIGNTTAHPGHDIAIEVTNISASPQDFSAAMSGPALQ